MNTARPGRSRVLSPPEARDFTLHQKFQTGSGEHPVFSSTDTGVLPVRLKRLTFSRTIKWF